MGTDLAGIQRTPLFPRVKGGKRATKWPWEREKDCCKDATAQTMTTTADPVQWVV